MHLVIDVQFDGAGDDGSGGHNAAELLQAAEFLRSALWNWSERLVEIEKIVRPTEVVRRRMEANPSRLPEGRKADRVAMARAVERERVGAPFDAPAPVDSLAHRGDHGLAHRCGGPGPEVLDAPPAPANQPA